MLWILCPVPCALCRHPVPTPLIALSIDIDSVFETDHLMHFAYASMVKHESTQIQK